MQFSKKAFLSLCSFFLAILICACDAPEYLSETDLSQYVSSNEKLSKEIVVNDVKIKISYKPTDLLVAQQLRMKKNPTQEDIDNGRNKYRNQYYFVMSLSKAGKEVLSTSVAGMNNFSDLLQTISFRMSEVVNLTTSGRDTIPVADFIHNRTFGMGNSTDLLFVFDKSQTKDQDWIKINLDEFGLGIGRQSVQFDIADLESTPQIYNIKRD